MPRYQKRFYYSGYATFECEAENSQEAWDKLEAMTEQGFSEAQINEYWSTLDSMNFGSDEQPKLVDDDGNVDDSPTLCIQADGTKTDKDGNIYSQPEYDPIEVPESTRPAFWR